MSVMRYHRFATVPWKAAFPLRSAARWMHKVSIQPQLFKQLRSAPALYANALDSVSSHIKSGDECLVVDDKGIAIARGIYNNASAMYRVRILGNKTKENFENASLFDLIAYRIECAKSLRRSLSLPNANTSTYRLINSEGDGLSGLIADHIGDCIVIQSSAMWTEKYREIIESSVRSVCPGVPLLWEAQTSRLADDGWCNVDTTETQIKEQLVMENGVAYEVHVAEGQKTGFYCDQRVQRRMIRDIAAGKDVLDLYCYTGGFALNACLGGASSVTAVDSSAAAVALLRRNMMLNKLPADSITCVQHDVIKFLSTSENSSFDLVVCDPPKFARSARDLMPARRKYRSLNTAAMNAVRKGGLLLTCSCSGAVAQTEKYFISMLQEAAVAANRDITILAVLGAGPDHPIHVAYPQGKYLSTVLVRVD